MVVLEMLRIAIPPDFPTHGQAGALTMLGEGANLKIVYSAPNRAHHYAYARELHQAGILKAFVCGFPRYSPRAPIPEIGADLRRVDLIQTLYIASQKLRMPKLVSEELAYWSKIRLDKASRKSLSQVDIFLYYNGCGLNSARWLRRRGGIAIVEAVNSHVRFQEQILEEEHKRLGLPWRSFHKREVKRRIAEIEEADYVLLPSIFVAKSFVANGIPAERLLRVPYPVQKIAGLASSEGRPTFDDGTFRVLYVGAISVRKGLRYLIEAFRGFKHPKKELWIVGPDTKPSGLEDILVPEGVKFFGPLKGEALQDVYRRATVFCLPSIEEGLALVLTEALHYSLPVIATENTGIEDLLEDDKGGMVVPIRDAAAIVHWLSRLADDRDLLESKRMEAAAAATRLANQSQARPGLATTLMTTFKHHRSQKVREST